jgi:SAM-dependent methyltransferase
MSIEFREGDVEALPFEDEAFDVVLSQFGHIFAPRPLLATREMLRVLRSGGRIAFSTWPPELFMGLMFKLVSSYMPPPSSGAAPPQQWGDPNIVRERLANAVSDLTFDRDLVVTPALSSSHLVADFERISGPVVKLVQILKDDPPRLAEFRAAFRTLIENYYKENLLHQSFLMTRARKRS